MPAVTTGARRATFIDPLDADADLWGLLRKIAHKLAVRPLADLLVAHAAPRLTAVWM
jgi:hypothetical protein